MRKTKETKDEVLKAKIEAEKALERLKQTEVLAAEAELEEKNKIEAVRKRIEEICAEENLFCGIIINSVNITNIVKVAIEENNFTKIQLTFDLYPNE